VALTRGRVIRQAVADRVAKDPPAARGFGRRLDVTVVDAHGEAERIVERARERANAVLAHAEIEAKRRAEEASREAERAEQAKASALYLALRRREEEREERDLDRVIATSRVLAERLLGAALELEPARIARLAREALREARGARRVIIEAHPLDAEALRTHVAEIGLDPASLDVEPNSSLARGDLCLHTDLGTLDAKLTPRLERLAAALRDALR
jgi:flagellar biosynthesis/type III secretory pathway protein FliH